ncbi:23S rRNA (uracil(1939)-C(5))-methyltransferase RlmD [Vibrio sp.]|uniref:23S rRNA (uracil(1939)-C(5))-methyltransferase RlmD n=1 Tax=Vibrio viridaestus TaxID=2487322 RepID=A0A3N9THM5_9VIBR|nr:23S rRNA (uracil(1939)-C(5))-methyltransferase RlmD [Vibrio viridaestus]MDC0610654.1 23S rRNA (uracil(1939)-C(5))-methyltransferase RlmD [Vibrio sp.]RQW63781.1 23S rRNA (uracil(1939)-C(5))-methyltransferase RlmD [Vibrio viridaestus]
MARFFQPKKKEQINKKHQSIDVIRIDHQGSGIAYQKSKPIFIDGALPEENVLFQLTEDKSKYARGQLIKVLKASPERVEPVCEYYDRCGGCQMQHLEHSAQVKYKQQTLMQLMTKFAGQSLSLSQPILSSELGYRRRARFSINGNPTKQKLDIGFRQKQSQDIVDIKACPVLNDSINTQLTHVRDLLQSLPRPNILGHVELIQADNTLVILLRHTKPLNEKEAQILMASVSEGISFYTMPESDVVDLLYGEKPFYDDGGVEIPFQPNHFIQVNKAVNQKMVTQAIDWLMLEDSDRVLDLFCGGGNFSLPIAKKVNSVVGIEGVDAMVKQAQFNARCAQIDNVEFYQANLEEDMTLSEWGRKKFDKILLDPARTGAKGIIEQCSALGAKRIVYVSCNPATLARDAQSLLEQGYKLDNLAMLDMFPHTSHLESMALFVK